MVFRDWEAAWALEALYVVAYEVRVIAEKADRELASNSKTPEKLKATGSFLMKVFVFRDWESAWALEALYVVAYEVRVIAEKADRELASNIKTPEKLKATGSFLMKVFGVLADEDSTLKAIGFGLSDFVKPDEKLNDIVGSAYYVAPEVLHRSYSTEADVWSVGVIAYILLCGNRPFWARTESGIFRAVLKADPNFNEEPWPSVSSEAKDFVKRMLNKDQRKRIAAQALCHPWLRNHGEVKVPLDVLIFKLLKIYMRSSSLRKAALRFALLQPSKNGTVSLDNIKEALMKNATDAMKDSRADEILTSLTTLQYRRMDFEDFCAAASSVYQLEALERWEQHARCADELFEKDGNRLIMIEELASELGLGPNIPVHAVLHDWLQHTDGKLSFLGFVKLLHGVSTRAHKDIKTVINCKHKDSEVFVIIPPRFNL